MENDSSLQAGHPTKKALPGLHSLASYPDRNRPFGDIQPPDYGIRDWA